MFQDGSDGLPTDSPLTLGTYLSDHAGPPAAEHLGGTVRQSHPDRRLTAGSRQACPTATNGPQYGQVRQRNSSVPQPANTIPGYNTPPAARARRVTFHGRLQEAGEPVVALSPQKVHWATGLGARAGAAGSREQALYSCPARRPQAPAEFRGSTLWSHPFASMRFHVLLNSLFKVLFNFPSRYLFAIGLVPVFSLRWSLPPTLGCIPKQPDSGGRDERRQPGS